MESDEKLIDYREEANFQFNDVSFALKSWDIVKSHSDAKIAYINVTTAEERKFSIKLARVGFQGQSAVGLFYSMARKMGEINNSNIKNFKLTVIRHGETEANLQKIVQGHKDYSLTEHGREQAKMVAQRLQKENLVAMFTSDLERAYNTADLILEGIQSPLVAQRHQLLRERSFGIFEGRHASELNRAAQEAGVPVVDFHPTEGESPKKIQRRANDFCDFLCQSVGNGLLKNTPKMNVKHQNGMRTSSERNCWNQSFNPFGSQSFVAIDRMSPNVPEVFNQSLPVLPISSSPICQATITGSTPSLQPESGHNTLTDRHPLNAEAHILKQALPFSPRAVHPQFSTSTPNEMVTLEPVNCINCSTISCPLIGTFFQNGDRNHSSECSSLVSGTSQTGVHQHVSPCPSPTCICCIETQVEDIPHNNGDAALVGNDDIPHIAVVSHGGFMRCLFKHFNDKHKCQNLPRKAYTKTPPNTSINTFVFTIQLRPKWIKEENESEDFPRGEWKVINCNCTNIHSTEHME